VRVIAFGRLSLFGRGAARLHDELISVGARWIEGSNEELRPFAEEADRKAVAELEQILAESPTLDAIPAKVQDRVREAAPRLFSELWHHIREEADAKGHDATQKLLQRAHAEADALRGILEAQHAAIERELERRVQLPLDFGDWDKAERDQFEQDKKHMEGRHAAIDRELETEPAEIEAFYKVLRHRLEPVGLVVLWPATRA
jgi:hypothetical protein